MKYKSLIRLVNNIDFNIMKLHYNSEATSIATTRKLKSVIAATEAKVEEVAYKTGDDVSKVSVFKTLPLLETPEGTFFSSNTILRYLATAFKKDLYGGDNLHHKALIDQWLDITSCDFEPSVRGINRHVNGEKIDFGKLMEDVNKFLAFVEKHCGEKKFLVGDSLSIADLSLASSVSVVFGVMFGEGQRKKYSHVLNWYTAVVNANKEVGTAELPKEAHEAFRGGKKGGEKAEKTEKADKPKDGGKDGKGKKEETKEAKKEESDDDPFAETAPKEKPAAPAAKPAAKKDDKKKAIAKSIVVFDVKVYDQETDLTKLFEKIKQISMDGLVWNEEPKIIPVAFGMNKLQVGCVVEDAKVSTEDIFEQIEGWDEVQSTDTVSFQKL